MVCLENCLVVPFVIGAVGVQCGHSVRIGRLLRLAAGELSESPGVGDDMFERGRLKTVGKGECPHRERGVGELE